MTTPVLSGQQLREMDAYTITHEPISSLDLMERAAGVCLEAFLPFLDYRKPVYVFCGAGNNGGDGLVIARTLELMRFDVRTYLLPFTTLSTDCATNLTRLNTVEMIRSANDFPEIRKDGVIIDALLGAGASREPSGLLRELIEYINKTPAKTVSVDVPSGLPTDTVPEYETIVKADFTATFQFPKRTFLLPETAVWCGEWKVLDIGLLPEGLNPFSLTDYLLTAEDIAPLLKIRSQFSHKGTYGHVLLIAGSKGKMGAAVLSAKAVLRSGAGLLTVQVPAIGLNVLQTAVPEAMCLIDEDPDQITRAAVNPELFTVVGIGPGLGTSEATADMLSGLLPNLKKVVIDADALNLLALQPHLLDKLPAETILTPHPREFERLFGKTKNSVERLELLRNSAKRCRCVIILKDAISVIASPDGSLYFNITGNPGMATGGSGDVLTGIVSGLLAQGYLPKDAARIGVYFHGLAGDRAAEKYGQEGLIASDLVEELRFTLLK
jgi:NAD(P)H-hydrate epimerase